MTGRSPDEFLKGLKNLWKGKGSKTAARFTYSDIKSFDLLHIAGMRKKGQIENIFDSVTPEERRDIAKFLAREKIYSDVLETFFDQNILADARVLEEPARDAHLPAGPSKGKEPLLRNDNTKEPEPARERGALDLDLNRRPRLELDLNQTPPAEENEPYAGDGGGE